MKYLVDVNQKQSEIIQKLIESNQYNSVAQFISVAMENQIYIEQSGEQSTEESIASSENSIINKINEKKRWEGYRVHNITTEPKTILPPTFEHLTLKLQNNDPKKAWLWGQINRILPVKIGIRVLYKELENNPVIEYNSFVKKAAEVAATINQEIKLYEVRNLLLRDEKISAGLPTLYEDASMTRYKSQFLSYKRKDNLLDGAFSMLRLANLESGKQNGKLFIGLTEAGLNFAKIINPVLDDSFFEYSLSDDEINFYLDHIKQNVISEHEAIKWLLKKIEHGINEREALNKELKNEFGNTWNASDAVINTQRAGLMARMTELKLLQKEKDGIRVTYLISKTGESFLSNN
jgi:hypothetical protein